MRKEEKLEGQTISLKIREYVRMEMIYAVMSALSFALDSRRSRSHCPSDLLRRKSTMFSKPAMDVEPPRRTGSSSFS